MSERPGWTDRLDRRMAVVSATDAAAFLGITAGYLRRLAREGKIEARKAGNHYKFRAGDLYDLWNKWNPATKK